MDKKVLIKTEEKRLAEVFSCMSEKNKDLSKGLIENAAFMYVELKELQADILENGAYIKYTSGNGYESIKENPSHKSYTTMISKYSTVMDQLFKLCKDNVEIEENDELMEFLKGEK